MTPCEHERELRADLLLLVRREDVDDAVDRLRPQELVCSVREDEVAGLGDGERGLDGLEVAHLADEHDVGVLAQDVLERVLEATRVGCPTSRWLTTQILCGWRNSIGSSIVMMCWRCSVLILSMIDASVVDLPEPVGPVTSTRPRGLLASSATTAAGRARRTIRILNGIARNAPATAPRCMKMLARKRDRFFTPNERSSSLFFSKCDLLLLGEDRVAELLGVDRAERRQLERDDRAVDAQERRRARR